MAKKATALLAILVSISLASGLSSENSFSFFGGSHEEGIPSSQQESVRVGFGFRSIQDSGVLLILRLEGSDSVSFTLNSGNQLQILLNQGGKITPLGSTTFTADFDGAWQRFEAVLLNGTLETRLQEVSFMVYTFTAPLQVQRVSFGGPRSFFEPVYLDFPVPRYYVGCLSNITLNSRDVLPDPLSAGISLGCCIAPRYPLWCVGNSATHNNLTLSFSHLANYTTELMVMSFRLRLRSTDDGLLVLSHPLTSPWTLHLLQGQLQLKPTSSGANWTVYCPGVFRDVAEWHQVEILLNSSSIVCEVDGIVGPAGVFTTEPSPSFPHTLQLGGTSNVPEAISGSGFDGCFQRLRLNGMDIDVTLLDGVSDVSSVIQPSHVLWSEPSSNVSELVVSAGGEYRLSTDDILLQLPHDAFADELTMPYQLEVERSIHFVALTRPRYGHLFIGHPAMRVEGFDYQNLLTSDPAQQIGYSHEGEDNITDVVVFRVWTGCADTVLAELLQLTLLISIEQRDTAPRIIQSESLRLAVGTRRVITPEMMTVFNPESSDLSQILFNLDSVSLKSSGCGSCDGEEGDGGVLVKNGVSIKFFNQEEINRGLISFQHYERFSTAPLLIRLGVTVQGGGGGQMDATIPVSLYQGHLNLISTSCLFVKEGGLGLLKAKHLSAVTDFEEEEDPVITYHLLTQPLYGNLQRYDPIIAQWVELTNSTMTHTLPFGGTSSSSFSQEDIENGHVRYFQSKFLSNNAIETFDFRLQSYDFSGPEINFCVTLLPDDELLLQPSITVDLSELVLLESSSAAINHSVLNISLENVDYLLIEPELDLQELGIIYTLVDPTAYGVLELRGLPLAAGDMFVHSDVTSNSLVYRHGGTEDHLDRFSFFVEGNSTPYIPIRAPNRTSNMTVVIHITAVNNHFPALVALEAIRPPEGCWVPVTERNINITDLDRPPNPLGIFLRKPRKPSENPNGFFTFRGESIQAIMRFSMQEVVSESIIFKHTLNSSASLNYTQVLRIDDGHNIIRKPVLISAVPLLLDVLIILPTNSQCLATIDANQHPLHVQFSHTQFSASLCDHFGNNANLVPEISVTVIDFPDHGQLFITTEDSRRNSNLTSTSHFLYHDVGRLVYILDNSSRVETGDEFVLEFSRGHSVPVLHTVSICVLPILEPLTLQVSALTLMSGGIGHITTEHLTVTTSRLDLIDSLKFNVLRGPRHGTLLNEATEDLVSVGVFTHAQLSRGDIVYEEQVHGNSVVAEDDILLEVCSDFRCLQQQLLPIDIYPISLSVQNTSVQVLEGGIYQFSLSDFNISAPQHFIISMDIPKEPDHGIIYILRERGPVETPYFSLNDVRTGTLYYNNTVQEKKHDSFEVSVEARDEATGETEVLAFIMRIVFELVNNYKPELVYDNKTMNVVQGGSALITTNFLRAHDFDACSDDDDLVWSVEKILPLAGYTFLDQDPGTKSLEVRQWTEGDIKNNRVYYRNTHAKFDILILNVSDGQKNTTATLYIAIVLVNFMKNASVQPFRLTEGGNKTITYQHLRYYADNDNSLGDSDFHITLTRVPRHGQLTLNGKPLFVYSSFTQDQIGTKKLVYTHSDTNTVTDRVDFTISVPIRKNGSKDDSFEIEIDSVDDDPPVATFSNPMFVVELQLVHIDRQVIQIVDLDLDMADDIESDKIECQLVQPLTRGRLESVRKEFRNNHTIKFTKHDIYFGYLWYRHLSSPDLQPDHLIFNLTDGRNAQMQVYNLTIVILPRVVSLHLRRLVVTENKQAHITHEELTVNHYYLSTVRGVITLVGIGPRHGELINIMTAERGVRSFSTDDITNKTIIYFHNGDENVVDSFQFEYEAREGSQYNRKSNVETFFIDITPVNDELPMIANNMTRLKLWATETVTLDEKYLNVTDYDTPPSKLNFTVQILGVGGYIAFAEARTSIIHWFTQADLRARRVVFVHEDGPRGEMTYNVTDGVHTATGSVKIYADSLALECHTDQWQSIEVEFQGSVTLTSGNLLCTTADGMNRQVSYHIHAPNNRLGHFEVDSETVSEFTSNEIDAGLVAFVHDETGYWKEREELLVSASSHPAVTEKNKLLLVAVHYPQPPPGSHLAVNNRLGVLEGGKCCINQSTLDGRNVRYEEWLGLQSEEIGPDALVIVFEVVMSPHHGNLTLDDTNTALFTQADLARGVVCYTHDDSETLSDEISLNVSIVFPNGTSVSSSDREEVLVIAISPLNDQPPVLKTHTLEKTLVGNFSTLLSAWDVQVLDGDSSPDQVTFRLVSLPNNTQLFVDASSLPLNSTFTQQDINQRRISLNGFRVGVSSFSFVFNDGSGMSSKQIEFFLIVEEQYLYLLNSEEITYFQTESGGTVIATRLLNTSSNTPRSETQFSVTMGPSHGRVTVGGSPVQTFTQEDIDNSRVSYVPHRGARHHRDNFTLNITNYKRTMIVEMSVRVMAWGQTTQSITIDFGSDSSQLAQPLPSEILQLNELERETGQPLTIELLREPTFGHLEMQVTNNPSVTLTKRFVGEISSFHYTELQQGWIVYVWDYAKPLTNLTVEDSFLVLVLAEGLQPGEAVISLTLSPPHGLTFPPPLRHISPTSPTTTASTGTANSDPPVATAGEGGFPVYTLVPIIGIILFLLVLILVVLVFCLTQQKRIKKKWVPSFSHPPAQPFQSPWSAAAAGPPIPTQVIHYDFDPSGMSVPDMEHHNSDTSSGFSEPDCSPRHTPVRSTHSPRPLYSSPAYHPPRSRMRSNVSITFSSGRHSTASEMSLDGGAPPSLLSSYSSQAAAAPSSFPRPPAAAVDSGVCSLESHPVDKPLDATSEEPPAVERKQPSRQDDSHHTEDDLSAWAADKTLPDLDDPDVRKLFHGHNPVLKKEEYWV